MPSRSNDVEDRVARQSSEQLRREANHIHCVLFGHDAPEDVRRQYASAIESAPVAASPRLDLDRLAARGVDLEALELAWRRRQACNALTQRFQVVCYLAEVRPENYGRFVTERRRFLAGSLALTLHFVRSLLKLIKGRRLLRIHDLG